MRKLWPFKGRKEDSPEEAVSEPRQSPGLSDDLETRLMLDSVTGRAVLACIDGWRSPADVRRVSIETRQGRTEAVVPPLLVEAALSGKMSREQAAGVILRGILMAERALRSAGVCDCPKCRAARMEFAGSLGAFRSNPRPKYND